jgi:hypothetical protein
MSFLAEAWSSFNSLPKDHTDKMQAWEAARLAQRCLDEVANAIGPKFSGYCAACSAIATLVQAAGLAINGEKIQ